MELARVNQLNDFIHTIKKSMIVAQKQRDAIKKQILVSRKQVTVVSSKLDLLKMNSKDAKRIIDSDVSGMLQ